MFVRSFGFAIVGLFLLSFTARAGALTVEGIVKDRTGRPIEGADVYIQAKDFSKIVKTDSNGHYKCDVAALGNYKVGLVINGSVRDAIRSTPANQHKHMVWIPPQTGTHIGGGSWIEVDDKSDVASRVAFDNIKKIDRKELTSDVILRTGGNSCHGGGSVLSGTGLAAGRTVSPLAASRKETSSQF